MSTVSIIVPCFDEEESLEQLHARLGAALADLERAGHRVDVLLFDNGSRDGTLAAMRRLFGADPRFAVHHHPTNVNVGGALRVGLPLVRGDVVVTMDSDCTYDPAGIGPLIGLLEAGAGIATGSPYHPEGRVENVPPWRLLLSQQLSALYRRVSRVKLHTYTSMFRAYRREVLEKIRWQSDGFLSQTEIVMEAAAAGYRTAELPAVLSRRRYGVSKIRVVRVMRDHLEYIARIVRDPRLRRRGRR